MKENQLWQAVNRNHNTAWEISLQRPTDCGSLVHFRNQPLQIVTTRTTSINNIVILMATL